MDAGFVEPQPAAAISFRGGPLVRAVRRFVNRPAGARGRLGGDPPFPSEVLCRTVSLGYPKRGLCVSLGYPKTMKEGVLGIPEIPKNGLWVSVGYRRNNFRGHSGRFVAGMA